MITLICGNHIDASRKDLQHVLQSKVNCEIRTLPPKTFDQTAFLQAIESTSLFGNKTVVVIEQLFTKMGKKTNTVDALLAILRQESTSADIIIWEPDEVSQSVIKKLGEHCTVKTWKLPVPIFKFLDALVPQNSPKLLSLLDECIHEEAAELVFALMVKRVRQLLIIASGEVPDKLASWQISRLTTQGKSFSIKQLHDFYRSLLTIEYSIKTGTTPFSLFEHIQQALIAL